MVQRMILPVQAAPKEVIQPEHRNSGLRDGESSFEKVMQRQNEVQKNAESSREQSAARTPDAERIQDAQKASEESGKTEQTNNQQTDSKEAALSKDAETSREKSSSEKTLSLGENISVASGKGQGNDSLLEKIKLLKKKSSDKLLSGKTSMEKSEGSKKLTPFSGKEKSIESEKSDSFSEKDLLFRDVVSAAGKEMLTGAAKDSDSVHQQSSEALQLQARTLEGKDDKKKNIKEIEISVIDKRSADSARLNMADKKSLEPDAGKENPAVEKNSHVKLNNLSRETVQENQLYIKEGEISSEGGGGKVQAPVLKEAESLFDRYLKGEGSREISRNIRFVMKDQNEGEIKLILKPESLGRVKIRLNLTENSITGRILVENSNVRNVFQDNLQQLSRMLEEQGYDSAKLDVAVDQHSGNGKEQGKEKQSFFSERLREEGANQFDAHVPGVQVSGSRPALDMIA